VHALKDRFLLHYSDPANWRLRNIGQHPLDPGWEVGSYSVCHPKIRAKIDVGTKVFDVVVKKGKGVVRSAFIVTKIRDIDDSRILYFDEFYFANEEPIELPGSFIQYRCMKLETWVRKYKQKSPWNKIVAEYSKCRIGERPRKIETKPWNNMVKQCSSIRKKRRFKKSSRAHQAKHKCK